MMLGLAWFRGFTFPQPSYYHCTVRYLHVSSATFLIQPSDESLKATDAIVHEVMDYGCTHATDTRIDTNCPIWRRGDPY
jgi:hypothetical protein